MRLTHTQGIPMTSHIIVEFNTLNAEKLTQYSQLAASTVANFGGHFLLKGTAQSLHGNTQFAKRAVIEFTSEKHAKDWYESSEYQALIALRNEAIESQFHLVTG